jgi:DNA polymerase epsilon subunit 1
LFTDEDKSLEIIKPGFYRNYSVEIAVNLVSVNAIMQA